MDLMTLTTIEAEVDYLDFELRELMEAPEGTFVLAGSSSSYAGTQFDYEGAILD